MQDLSVDAEDYASVDRANPAKPEKLVADLYKIIEQQCREIATLKSYPLELPLAEVAGPLPVASPSMPESSTETTQSCGEDNETGSDSSERVPPICSGLQVGSPALWSSDSPFLFAISSDLAR